MAVSLLSHEVSDLCIGKPALRSLSVSATVADALSALKRIDESYVSVWSCDHRSNDLTEASSKCVGKICMVDVICFLAKEENLLNPGTALESPVSVLIPKDSEIITHVEPNASLLEAIDLILEGKQNLVIPIPTRKKFPQKSSSIKSKTLHNHHREFCWITQEDILRYLFNSIGVISPTPNYSINSLNIIDKGSDLLAVHYDDPASSALPFIAKSLLKQTSVAITDLEGKLIGEISPFTLNSCDEKVAAAIATLSAGDLMAYIDCGGPPDELFWFVKERLREKNMKAFLEMMEDDWGISSSSSSDEELSPGSGRSNGKSIVYSTRVMARSEATVCYPWSSLAAVMIQALARRVSYVWVIEEDGTLAGIVTSTGMLSVFRDRLKSMS